MEIWIKGSRRFRFPVLPPGYDVTSERDNQTVDINSIGEIDLGGNRKLREISFSSYFPRKKDEYESGGHRSPESCVKTIEKIKNGGPCKLIITGSPVNFRCRITLFTYSEQDGTGDIHFSITFKEHRGVSIGSSSVIPVAGMH